MEGMLSIVVAGRSNRASLLALTVKFYGRLYRQHGTKFSGVHICTKIHQDDLVGLQENLRRPELTTDNIFRMGIAVIQISGAQRTKGPSPAQDCPLEKLSTKIN